MTRPPRHPSSCGGGGAPPDLLPSPPSSSSLAASALQRVRSLDCVATFRMGGRSRSVGSGGWSNTKSTRKISSNPDAAAPRSPRCVASRFSRRESQQTSSSSSSSRGERSSSSGGSSSLPRRLSWTLLPDLPDLNAAVHPSPLDDGQAAAAEQSLSHPARVENIDAANDDGGAGERVDVALRRAASSLSNGRPLLALLSVVRQFGLRRHQNDARGSRFRHDVIAVTNFMVFILIALNITNGILDAVQHQVHRLSDSASIFGPHYDTFGYYDALSTEVLKPPFRYKRSEVSLPSRSRLGSAALGTVANVLSPVLPFAGGVDLRRKGNWFSWWRKNDGSDQDTADSVARMPRGGGGDNHVLDADSEAKQRPSAKRKSKKSTTGTTPHMHVLSASDPFLSTNDIAQMHLGEMSRAFVHAMGSNRDGYTESSADANDAADANEEGEAELEDEKIVRNALEAMDYAVAASRGEDVSPASTRPWPELNNGHDESTSPTSESNDVEDEEGRSYGDIDALQFCAALRLFAEWRLLRTVPDGYKGYAVGMQLGHKDVVQNVAKIEAAVHAWIDEQRDELKFDEEVSCENAEAPMALRSPTLRQLLQHERDTHQHPKLPRLKEKSAAMGLLWVRRQLEYQTAVFANILQIPDTYSSAHDAVGAAYKEVYDRYHGYMVQKIFNYSFKAAPEAETIYKHMNPRRLEEVLDEAARGGGVGTVEDETMAAETSTMVDGSEVEEGIDEVATAEEGEELIATTWTTTISTVPSLVPVLPEAAALSFVNLTLREMTFVSDPLILNMDAAAISTNVTHVIQGVHPISSFSLVDNHLPVVEEVERLGNVTVKVSDHEDDMDDNAFVHEGNKNPIERFLDHLGRESDKFLHHLGAELDSFGKHIESEAEKIGKHVEEEWNKLGRHVESEWNKFAGNVVGIFQGNNNHNDKKSGATSPSSSPTFSVPRGGGGEESSKGGPLTGTDLEEYVSKEMLRDAEKHIVAYLKVVRPLLDDLAGLFDEMNMDDPTKV